MGNQYKNRGQGQADGLSQIQFLDPEMAPNYTNAVLIGYTKWEVALQYVFINVNRTGNDYGFFVMTPATFKKMTQQAQAMLSEFERKYGTIDAEESKITIAGADEIPH